MKYANKKLIKIGDDLHELSEKKRSEAGGKISLYEIAKVYLLYLGEKVTEENIKAFIKEF